MTKISINRVEVRKIVNTNLYNAESHLLKACNYCDRLIIPNDYINKNYLNWFNDNLKAIKNSLYDLRENLMTATNTISKTIDNMENDVRYLKKSEVKVRKGFGK